jgi:hypothetical protein
MFDFIAEWCVFVKMYGLFLLIQRCRQHFPDKNPAGRLPASMGRMAEKAG